MLDTALDLLRIRQYFNVVTMTRQVVAGVGKDVSFLDTVRRAVAPLPWERLHDAGEHDPFPPLQVRPVDHLVRRRVAVVASGGSGVLASLVGVARALEECGIRPAAYSLCSGASLFGFPLAAGKSAAEVADFTLSLRPGDLADVDWPALLTLLPHRARGFTGILRGERVERVYRDWLGDLTLGELPIPAYVPVWNVEHNTSEYLGPRTHPGLSVARAVRTAVALPLFIQAVPIGRHTYYDGGTLDILPVRPVLDIERPPDTVLAVGGFHRPGYAGDDMTGWRERPASILDAAWQVRSGQHLQLGRDSLERLEREVGDVITVDPVPYRFVAGVGVYREFLDNRHWPEFMRMGRRATVRALHRHRPVPLLEAVAGP